MTAKLTQDEMRALLRECAFVVQPGETLVLRLPGHPTPEELTQAAERIEFWRERHGVDMPVLVLPSDVDVGRSGKPA